jgi:Arc/MetJ-type ribon-helix-helix transcriptional regulator
LPRRIEGNEETPMPDHTVVLRLNQQQLELIDRTIAQGVAKDRAALVRLALREYAAKRRDTTAQAAARRGGTP